MRRGWQPSSKGPAEFFTGEATIQPLYPANEQTRAAGASVSFEPGARSAWHTHPAGQTLIVTAGHGWVQAWGQPKQAIAAGDVVWTPPGVKHWHGATAGESMTHIAIQEHVDGKVVDWMEHVGDEQYGEVVPAKGIGTQTPLVRIAELEIDPAQLDSYKAAVTEEIDTSIREEPGVLAIYSVGLTDNPAHIRFLEVYRDQNAYERHLESRHFKKYVATTKPMITSRKLLQTDPVVGTKDSPSK